MIFLLPADFFKIKSLRDTIKVSNSLDPVQALCFVEPDLCPNCLKWLSANNISRKRVKTKQPDPFYDVFENFNPGE